MKYPENIHPPVTEFERKTGSCPLILATLMLDQLKNYFWAELAEDLADELAQKAEIVFAGNPRWRKKFQGRRGHDWLEMFMRHWLAAELFKRKSPLFRELPDDFKIGKPLPDISLPRQLEKSSSKKNRKKSVKSLPLKHYVHGYELLAA